MGCACARRACHLSHRENFKSRDIMDAFDWPLTRMRSSQVYFLVGGMTPPTKIGVRDAPNILLKVCSSHNRPLSTSPLINEMTFIRLLVASLFHYIIY